MRFALAVVLLVACGRKHAVGGLPPATDWGAKPAVDVDMEAPSAAHGETGDDPDPQEAPGPVDPNGQMPNDSVHGGGGAGNPPVESLGRPPPEPNRPIDPKHRIAGVIAIDAKLADKVQQPLPVYLAVKRVGPDGNAIGLPIAVQKLVWTQSGMAFELTENDAMVATGDQLTGEVVVTAHYDQDGEATTKTPGDVLGQAKVKIPADHVTITLDTLVP